MRMSEAIRLGAMLGPQARGTLTRQHRKYGFFGPVVTEYCALGAAFAAVGAPTVEGTYSESGPHSAGFRGNAIKHKAGDKYHYVDHPWVELTWQQHSCPACPSGTMEVYRLIPHLNDTHRWTREQIAYWLEAIELAHQPTCEPERQLPKQEFALREMCLWRCGALAVSSSPHPVLHPLRNARELD